MINMNTMKKIITLILSSATILSVLSCSKDQQVKYVTKVLELGYEGDDSSDEVGDGTSETKTFCSGSGTVKWNGNDKPVFVFDEDEQIHTFSGTNSSGDATRKVTCTEWPVGKDVKMVVWTGQNSETDNTLWLGTKGVNDNSWVVSGKSGVFRLQPTQSLSTKDSFSSTVNIAVKKNEDTKLRPVFGYLRFKLDTKIQITGGGKTENVSDIQKIELTSTQDNLAGDIQINYEGDTPVASFTANQTDKITLYPCFNTTIRGHYRAGYVFLAMLPGEYTNVTLTIHYLPVGDNGDYTYADKNAANAAADAAELTVVKYAKSLKVERGKYTNAGTLPEL